MIFFFFFLRRFQISFSFSFAFSFFSPSDNSIMLWHLPQFHIRLARSKVYIIYDLSILFDFVQDHT